MGGRSWSLRGERPRLVTHMLAHGVCHRTFAGSGVSRATESVQSSHVSRRRLVRGVALGTWGRAQRGPLAAVSPAARTRPPLPAWVPDGTTAAERFAGRSPRRCVPRSWPQSADPQLLSLRRNGWWASSPRRGGPMPCARPCPCRRPPCHPPAGGVWGVEAMWERVWRPSSCERARPRLC